jgi:hypothetical protein
MTNTKMLFLFVVFAFFLTTVNAQPESKDVTIIASGSGITFEDAKQSALRSTIQQAFGVFISSKTEIFNDQVVADQMASVSSGNIKSFDILNQDQLPDGKWGVTLKTVVSVDKLTSFVQAKGTAIEFKGGIFALNIKQQLLNEQGEIKAVAEMVGVLHEPMQMSFDYTIKSSDPISLDSESKNWEIPLTITATCNKNIDFCANYFIKTLSALSLTTAEVATYKSLNKQVFPLSLKYINKNLIFYLRKQTSVNLIISLLANWNFYTRLFAVQSGMDEFYSKIDGGIHILTNNSYGPTDPAKNDYNASVSFPSAGSIAGIFQWNDKRTLSQIDQMTGYSVKPRGVISNFKNGGYVVYEEGGHGLVVAVSDLGIFKWHDAKDACEELVMNGYDDWHLPSRGEWGKIFFGLGQSGDGSFGFKPTAYWSSDENKSYCGSDCVYYEFWFEYNKSNFTGKDNLLNVRAVRTF